MDMLDPFLWILEDEQLKLKYSSLIWPYKISLKVKESLENIAIYILEKPYLTSIGLIEPQIADLQATIENSIRLAIIPIKAYCKEYNIHSHLYNINVESYVKLV